MPPSPPALHHPRLSSSVKEAPAPPSCARELGQLEQRQDTSQSLCRSPAGPSALTPLAALCSTLSGHCCVLSPVAAAHHLERASPSWLCSGVSLLLGSARPGERDWGISGRLTQNSGPWILRCRPLCTANQPLPPGTWRFHHLIFVLGYVFNSPVWLVYKVPPRGACSPEVSSLSRMPLQVGCSGNRSPSTDAAFPSSPRTCYR